MPRSPTHCTLHQKWNHHSVHDPGQAQYLQPKKIKLYQVFREFGRVIRTDFLLQYVGDSELRAIIQRETNKSESFNGFAKWLAFGNGGVTPTNNWREMRKYLKYNHLLAYLIIYANAALLTDALHELASEGHRIDPEAVAALSLYLAHHLSALGSIT